MGEPEAEFFIPLEIKLSITCKILSKSQEEAGKLAMDYVIPTSFFLFRVISYHYSHDLLKKRW
ncbi:MAG: hypothetical protein ACXADY_17905 [Candidatus Hodarchaeales archaeon]|jgi:hypothetical protein